MQPALDRERPPDAALDQAEPELGGDHAADPVRRDPRRAQLRLCEARAEEELVVLAIREGVIERGSAVAPSERMCIGVDRHLLGVDPCADPGGGREAREIEGEAIGDVHRRAHPAALDQGETAVDARLEAEMTPRARAA
jgi:hypothetical protein